MPDVGGSKAYGNVFAACGSEGAFRLREQSRSLRTASRVAPAPSRPLRATTRTRRNSNTGRLRVRSSCNSWDSKDGMGEGGGMPGGNGGPTATSSDVTSSVMIRY